MRNKFLSRILGVTLGLAMAIGVGVGVAANNRVAKGLNADDTVTTYTFTSASWGAKIGNTNANWTSGKAGGGFSNNGIQVTTSASGANGTSPTSFTNVSRVVLTYNTNKSAGAGTASVKIGSNTAVSKDWGYSSGDGRTANYTLTYDFSPNQTGNVKITLETTTNSIYLVSCAITESGAGAPTVTNIAKKTAPTKTSYYQGESFDPSGLVVTVSYSVGNPEDISYDDYPGRFSWSPETITSAGNVLIQYLTNDSLKITQAVTLVTPMTVPEAITAIDAAGENPIQDAYVSGFVSQVDTYFSSYHSITYWISVDGTTSSQLQVYGGKGLNGANFESKDDLGIGDQVVVKGTLQKHNDTYEFASNSKILSLSIAPRINSISFTPSDVTAAPNIAGDVDSLFIDIDIDQNEASHKTIADIDWSSDDDDVIYIDEGEYLVTGNHRESTTIKASIDGVVYGSATFTVIDPNVYVMDYDTTIWTKVDNPSTLAPGDKVILTGVKNDVTYAAGTYPGSGNNVLADTEHPLTVLGNRVAGVVNTMVYTLEEGSVDGSVAFKDSSDNYLYAAGSTTKNYMKTQATIDGNASFIIDAEGNVVAQGSSTHNNMRYNNTDTSNFFACYTSDSTIDILVKFYKLSGESGNIDLPSYASIATAYDDGIESYIRLGVSLSEDDWNIIDSEFGISGYGVMLIRETTLTTAGFSTVEEVFRSTANSKPTLKDLSKESNTAPQDNFIAAKIKITLDTNIDVVFRAATYVISSNGSYCFINEVSGSLYDLI